MQVNTAIQKLCLELGQYIAFFVVQPRIAHFREVLTPLEYTDVIDLTQKAEEEIENSIKGLASLSVTNHWWHNAAQPFLTKSMTLHSRGCDLWLDILCALRNTRPVFVKVHSNMKTVFSGFFNVRFRNTKNVLDKPVNHITSLTRLRIDITRAISEDVLHAFRGVLAPEAVNLKSLTVSVGNLYDEDEYEHILMCLLCRIKYLEFLDWTSNCSDRRLRFFEHLSLGQRLRRLNLRLLNEHLSHTTNTKSALANLECIQVTPYRSVLGTQYDLLAEWDFPSLHTAIIDGYHVFDRLRLFLDRQSSHIKHLFMKHVWRNEQVLMYCSDAEVLYADTRYMPNATYGSPAHASEVYFSHPSLKKMVLRKFDECEINYVVLYRLCNKYHFPHLTQVQILNFDSPLFCVDEWLEGWAHDVAQWIKFCSGSGINVTDKNGYEVSVVETRPQ